MRHLIAALLPVLAGAFAYAGLAWGSAPHDWLESSLLLLPAMLIGVMAVALLCLPLWSVLAHRTRYTRTAFLCVATAALVLLAGGLAAIGAFDRLGGAQSAALLFVPALVLVTTFGMLMDPRRVRGGKKADDRQP